MATTFEDADEARWLAQDLIDGLQRHRWLRTQRIAWVFRQADALPDRWVRVSVLSGVQHYLTHFDALALIEKRGWALCDRDKRRALVDHALCCLTATESGLAVRQPPVAEFAEVVERNGLWHKGLTDMAVAMKPHALALPGVLDESRGAETPLQRLQRHAAQGLELGGWSMRLGPNGKNIMAIEIPGEVEPGVPEGTEDDAVAAAAENGARSAEDEAAGAAEGEVEFLDAEREAAADPQEEREQPQTEGAAAEDAPADASAASSQSKPAVEFVPDWDPRIAPALAMLHSVPTYDRRDDDKAWCRRLIGRFAGWNVAAAIADTKADWLPRDERERADSLNVPTKPHWRQRIIGRLAAAQKAMREAAESAGAEASANAEAVEA